MSGWFATEEAKKANSIVLKISFAFDWMCMVLLVGSPWEVVGHGGIRKLHGVFLSSLIYSQGKRFVTSHLHEELSTYRGEPTPRDFDL